MRTSFDDSFRGGANSTSGGRAFLSLPRKIILTSSLRISDLSISIHTVSPATDQPSAYRLIRIFRRCLFAACDRIHLISSCQPSPLIAPSPLLIHFHPSAHSDQPLTLPKQLHGQLRMGIRPRAPVRSSTLRLQHLPEEAERLFQVDQRGEFILVCPVSLSHC